MTLELTADAVIRAGAVIAALGSATGAAAAIIKWFVRQRRQDEDIRDIRREQCVMSYALLACLDGLKQLGANGNVTDAHNRLEKHINKKVLYNIYLIML